LLNKSIFYEGGLSIEFYRMLNIILETYSYFFPVLAALSNIIGEITLCKTW